jgi:hypothetical protein
MSSIAFYSGARRIRRMLSTDLAVEGAGAAHGSCRLDQTTSKRAGGRAYRAARESRRRRGRPDAAAIRLRPERIERRSAELDLDEGDRSCRAR